MGKKADFQPRWLVSLMCQWARRIAAEEDGGVGFPKRAAWLTVGRATNETTDPTGYSAQEFADLEVALKACHEVTPWAWAAMMMYYKPWCIEQFRADGWPFANSVYYARLHVAHEFVSTRIHDLEDARTAKRA